VGHRSGLSSLSGASPLTDPEQANARTRVRPGMLSSVMRSYYSADSAQMAADTADAILGRLTSCSPYEVAPKQRDAWEEEVRVLKKLAADLKGAHFFMEFSIPRMGRRADAIVLWAGVVFVLEFKVGADRFASAAIDQVLGYALDLKNFHETSHARPIVPMLVATKAVTADCTGEWYADKVAVPVLVGRESVGDLVRCFGGASYPPLAPQAWEAGRYKPTPTIIEAAQALYKRHTVEEIARSEAGATNLTATAAYIGHVIDEAKIHRRKAICFVTGVPGSGKTLAGLNVATQRMQAHDDEHAVFLSGNGPLVAVLRTALTLDAICQAKEEGRATSRAVGAHPRVCLYSKHSPLPR
jgi:hypothetical protein